jgi:hypothetical protein
MTVSVPEPEGDDDGEAAMLARGKVPSAAPMAHATA